MGLSNFEEHSSRSSYCSSSTLDRSLTLSLLDSSECPLRSSSRFAHTPDWAEGLDLWSLSSPSTRPTNKQDLSRRMMDFHRELGLYLPRHEKPSSAPISLKTNIPIQSAKGANNPFTPERLRHLLRKEKDLLLQTDLANQHLLFESSLPPPPPAAPANSLRQCSFTLLSSLSLLLLLLRLATSIDFRSTNEVSFPLRHLPNHSPSSSQPLLTPTLNPDALKSLLKEHLTSLLTRGASTVQTHRPVNILPLEEMKEPTTSNRTDNKPIDSANYFAQHRSTLGLTVTQMELATNATKNYQSISLEKMAQQRNSLQDNESVSSQASSRPSTQPGRTNR